MHNPIKDTVTIDHGFDKRETCLTMNELIQGILTLHVYCGFEIVDFVMSVVLYYVICCTLITLLTWEFALLVSEGIK